LLNKLETNKKLMVYFPLILYWIILFIATTLPGKDMPDINISDKVEHFTAYFILAVLFNLALMFQNKHITLKRKAWLYTLIILMTYAGLDEIHQLFVPGRDCDIFDWIADSSGVVLGLALVRFLISFFNYRPQTR
jgi:VanZ family protein